MRAWLFQTVDRRRIELIAPGRTERWCVRRYRHEMQPGDLVLIWLGGARHERGIHGYGRLISAPYTTPDETTYHVDVEYDRRLTPLVPAAVLRAHPLLHALAILHMPRATNFRLDHVQAQALTELIALPKPNTEISIPYQGRSNH